MGVDWVRMKIRPGVTTEEVEAWVARERAVYGGGLHTSGEILYSIFRDHPFEGVSFSSKAESESHQSQFRRLFEFPVEDFPQHIRGKMTVISREFDPQSHEILQADMVRNGVVTHNSLFPLEWRDNALDTLPPNQLADAYSRWSSYLAEVRDGNFRGYLFDLFLYDCYWRNQNKFCYENLVWAVETSGDVSNAWAKKPAFLELREKYLQDRPNNFYDGLDERDFPKFSFDRAHDEIQPEQLRKYDELVVWVSDLGNRIEIWQSQTKGQWRIRRPHYNSWNFDERLKNEILENNWLNCFMNWCGKLVHDGSGLFLWG